MYTNTHMPAARLAFDGSALAADGFPRKSGRGLRTDRFPASMFILEQPEVMV